MKIDKIIKMKSGKYKIILSDKDNIITYDEVILNNNLLFKQELDDELLFKIKEENVFYDLLHSCIKYISKRLRSELEIKYYLEKKTSDCFLIDNIIKYLKEKGLINDFRFTKAYINDKMNLSKLGISKIKYDLSNLGIDEKMINDAIDEIDFKKDSHNLKKIIDKKIKTNYKYSSNYLKQKILNDMINLGYEKEDILSILDNYDINDDVLYKKEYDKLYHKLCKKYQGNELEYQIKNRLYKKGFKNKEN